jgi:transcriptional regulator with XRE-family HTH domain
MNPDKSLLLLFSQAVKRERAKLKISQEELAARVGLHRTYIGMIERAEKNITLSNMGKIADALQVPLWKLLKE